MPSISSNYVTGEKIIFKTPPAKSNCENKKDPDIMYIMDNSTGDSDVTGSDDKQLYLSQTSLISKKPFH